MSEDESENEIVAKGRIFDNMETIQEYTTERIARKAGIPPEEAEEYLEELADEGRIRKRERGSMTKWVRFG